MASSSQVRNPCSNENCRNDMDAPNPGWKSEDHEVKLCDQCFIAFTIKQFCNIYHKNLGVWIMCKFCDKKVHFECKAAQDSYIKLQDGEVVCNECGTLDMILISNCEDIGSPSPVATAPTTLVVNDQLTDQENVLDRRTETTPQGLTSIEKNEIPTGNSASVNTEPSARLNVGGAKVNICSKRRKRDIGSTNKSNKNRIKMSEVLAEVRETMQSPHGSNIPSFVANKSDKENPNEVERIPLNPLTAKTPIHSKRMCTDEIGSSSKGAKKMKRSKVKDAREQVGVCTPIENVGPFYIHSKLDSTYEFGSNSKSTKNVNERSKVNYARELAVSPKVVEISRGTPMTTQITAIENVVTLPNANKKHPRHRHDCLCIVCIQPASGSKHHASCECKACVTLQSRGKKHSQKPPKTVASRRKRKGLPKPTLIESSNASPLMTPDVADPGNSNHTHQTTVSGVSENNGDTNLSNMHSKILPFDLNLPPADLNEEF